MQCIRVAAYDSAVVHDVTVALLLGLGLGGRGCYLLGLGAGGSGVGLRAECVGLGPTRGPASS